MLSWRISFFFQLMGVLVASQNWEQTSLLAHCHVLLNLFWSSIPLVCIWWNVLNCGKENRSKTKFQNKQGKYVLSHYIVEYDVLARLGISDPKGFIRKRVKGEKLGYLSTCCVGSSLQDRIEAEIDEALATSTWVDVMVSTQYGDRSVQRRWAWHIFTNVVDFQCKQCFPALKWSGLLKSE